jgi:hypothetical protein
MSNKKKLTAKTLVLVVMAAQSPVSWYWGFRQTQMLQPISSLTECQASQTKQPAAKEKPYSTTANQLA